MKSIRDIMSSQLELFPPYSTLADITKKMHRKGYSCALIGETSHVDGIITERDIVRVFAQHHNQCIDPQAIRAVDIMSQRLVSISADADIFDALVLTISRKIRHLLVIDGDELQGLITYSDLVIYQRRYMQEQQELLQQYLHDKTRELQNANERLTAMSLEDALTGIGNRRAMDVDLRYNHDEALRYKQNYSLILIDIDHFKAYNDHYGHQAGDKVLHACAQIMQRNLRGPDRIYRYGGEEFLVLLPQVNQEIALMVGQRLLDALQGLAMPHQLSEHGMVTASAGVCDNSASYTGVDQILQNADIALYAAKAQGRACVCPSLVENINN